MGGRAVTDQEPTMNSPSIVHLQVPAEALPALTFALQRTVDDLEARALVAVDRDPTLGPASAAEYRDDIGRLSGLLGQLGATPGRPDPERAAVVWFDGVYTVDGDRPVRHQPSPALTTLLEAAIEKRHDGRLTPGAIIETLAEATGVDQIEVLRQLTEARRTAARDVGRDVDRHPAGLLARDLSGPDLSSR
jgi:hypothetical protein